MANGRWRFYGSSSVGVLADVGGDGQCVDITFAEPKDVPEVNASNCFNSSDIGFNLVFATTSLSGADAVFSTRATWLAVVPAVLALVWGLL